MEKNGKNFRRFLTDRVSALRADLSRADLSRADLSRADLSRADLSRADLSRAARILKKGGIVIYPTETFFALGADPRSSRGVKKIFQIKGRSALKSLPLIAADMKQVLKVVDLNTQIFSRLAKKFWPGPLTMVLPGYEFAELAGKARQARDVLARGKSGRGILARGIAAPDGTIAIRISADPTARVLAAAVGFPIVSTSANRSGKPPSRDITAVAAQFRGALPAHILLSGGRQRVLKSGGRQRVLQAHIGPASFRTARAGNWRTRPGGARQAHKPSTIIAVSKNRVKLLRKGAIPFSLIKKCASFKAPVSKYVERF